MDPLTGNPTLDGDAALNIATWMFVPRSRPHSTRRAPPTR
jgi:hypothetical protein